MRGGGSLLMTGWKAGHKTKVWTLHTKLCFFFLQESFWRQFAQNKFSLDCFMGWFHVFWSVWLKAPWKTLPSYGMSSGSCETQSGPSVWAEYSPNLFWLVDILLGDLATILQRIFAQSTDKKMASLDTLKILWRLSCPTVGEICGFFAVPSKPILSRHKGWNSWSRGACQWK